MQAQAYEGYFENGLFFTSGKSMTLPERRRVYITVLDEPVSKNVSSEAWRIFLDEINQIYDEPLQEFERVGFREVAI